MALAGEASRVVSATRNGRVRKSYARIPDVLAIPDLIKIQSQSYRGFREDGLRELFDEISPIESFNKNLRLYFPGYDKELSEQFGLDYRFAQPTYTEEECRDRDATYSTSLYVRVLLDNRQTDEAEVQEVYMGEFPLMTTNGTFIINGAERVVVSQLIRSAGAYFTVVEDSKTGRELCKAKLIPIERFEHANNTMIGFHHKVTIHADAASALEFSTRAKRRVG